MHDHLTFAELKPGFTFQGERIPLINPRRGIFKPRQMRFLLSIKTVFPIEMVFQHFMFCAVFETDDVLRFDRLLNGNSRFGLTYHRRDISPKKYNLL